MKGVKRSILFGVVTSVLILSLSLFLTSNRVGAAAVTGFNAGKIMEDSLFTRKNSMSVSQIQSFLNSKVKTCDTNGTQQSEYGGGTRAQYGRSKGYPPPYTCLKDYRQSGKSAAQIIHIAAQDYNINPQVLIVLLQKEQGLVTDTWPWSLQYKTATGYGCPDTADCNSDYFGFTNQVRWAAKMFRAILNQSDTWYTPYELGNNRIYWHPDTGRCGSSTVNIQNLSTVALYSYTPYRPNQAALNAGYGTGNSCSSYGNRNFYQYFKDWFGFKSDNFKYERLAGASPSVNTVSGTDLGDSTATLTIGEKIKTYYYDNTNNRLRESSWTGTRWVDTILDGSGSSIAGSTTADVGQHVTARLYNGRLQLFYYDATNGNLRHAWWTGSSWRFETFDGATNSVGGLNADVGRDPALTVYNGRLQLFYYDATNGNLRHAWWTGSSWRFETFDGTASSVGKLNGDIGSGATIKLYNGRLQLFYYDATNGNLRHAWWTGSSWRFETFDGTASSVGKLNGVIGRNPSLAVYEGKLHAFYYDATNGNLRHAWWTGSSWRFETFDGTASSVAGNDSTTGTRVVSIVFDKELVVFYYDESNDRWMVGLFDGSWRDYTLDGATASVSGATTSGVDGQLSAAVYQGNSLQVFYQDPSGYLRHSWLSR